MRTASGETPSAIVYVYCHRRSISLRHFARLRDVCLLFGWRCDRRRLRRWADEHERHKQRQQEASQNRQGEIE
jgi:hypothetical protein